MERTCLLHCCETLGVTNMTSKSIQPTIVVLSPKHLGKNREKNLMLRKISYIPSIHFEYFVEGRRFEILDKLPFLQATEPWVRAPKTTPTPTRPNVAWSVQILGPNPVGPTPGPSILCRSLPYTSGSSLASPFFKFSSSQTDKRTTFKMRMCIQLSY